MTPGGVISVTAMRFPSGDQLGSNEPAPPPRGKLVVTPRRHPEEVDPVRIAVCHEIRQNRAVAGPARVAVTVEPRCDEDSPAAPVGLHNAYRVRAGERDPSVARSGRGAARSCRTGR